MRTDKNAAVAEKKATKAFYPELLDEELRPLQKDETAVSERERIDKEVEEKHFKSETWHTFMTF
jgi:hypothetical protein